MSWTSNHGTFRRYVDVFPFPLDQPALRQAISWRRDTAGMLHCRANCGELTGAAALVQASLLEPVQPVCEVCFHLPLMGAGPLSVYLYQVTRAEQAIVDARASLVTARYSKSPLTKLRHLAAAASWFGVVEEISSEALRGAARAVVVDGLASVAAARAELGDGEKILCEAEMLRAGLISGPLSAFDGFFDADGPRFRLSASLRESYVSDVLAGVDPFPKLVRIAAGSGVHGAAGRAALERWFAVAERERVEVVAARPRVLVAVPARRFHSVLAYDSVGNAVAWWYSPGGEARFASVPAPLAAALDDAGQRSSNKPVRSFDISDGDDDDVLSAATALLRAGAAPADALDFARLAFDRV